MIEKTITNWRLVRRKILSLLLSRGVLVGMLLVIEFFLLWAVTSYLFDETAFYLSSYAFSVIVLIYAISRRTHPSYTLVWAIFIFLLPPVGAVIYLLYNLQVISPWQKARQDRLRQLLVANLTQLSTVWEKVRDLPTAAQHQMAYLSQFENFPTWDGTSTHFLPSGEDFFASLKRDLRRARRFIFLEYYIIQSGQMWDEILDVLIQKAAAGVEVRLMYDDVGCLFTLPDDYPQKLAAQGLKVHVINRFRPILDLQVNNRDHRKIAIIDGQIGYTGGINLADEYINAYPKLGHWKDTAVRLEGPAVNNLTVMFLQFWNAGTFQETDFQTYLTADRQQESDGSDGFVQPFGDDPLDYEYVSKNVYLNIINSARRQLTITSPYLVPDNEIVTAMTLAAKNGLDVKLIVPAVGDHWYVHALSQSFYPQLLESGVQIFEYSPGFIHSKTILADGDQAVVGSINMDYRSFYLQYEAGVYLYRTKAVSELQADLAETLRQCRQIDLNEVKEIRWGKRLVRSFLRLIAPLV